jgi:hypothetical protein
MCLSPWPKLLGCVLMLIISLIPLTSSGQTVLPLRVMLSFDSKDVPLHALLKAHLEITNEDAKHAYVVHLGLDNEGAFTLTVKRLDRTIAIFRRQSTPGLHTTGRERIQPGSTYTQELILNRWYDFPASGTYDVNLAMDAKVTGNSSAVDSSPALQDLRASVNHPVVISARDEAYLEQRCQQLLETIRFAPSYKDVIQAADGLNAIHDPIAAGYLTQAAEARPPVAHRFISGLEGLGTQGAVEGLLELAKSPDAETKVLATSSLERLEIASQNGPLKDQIRSGLAALSQH